MSPAARRLTVFGLLLLLVVGAAVVAYAWVSGTRATVNIAAGNIALGSSPSTPSGFSFECVASPAGCDPTSVTSPSRTFTNNGTIPAAVYLKWAATSNGDKCEVFDVTVVDTAGPTTLFSDDLCAFLADTDGILLSDQVNPGASLTVAITVTPDTDDPEWACPLTIGLESTTVWGQWSVATPYDYGWWDDDAPADAFTIQMTAAATTASLTVIKTVDNTGGGTAEAKDWTMDVTAVNPTQSSFPGSGSGTTITIDPGAYSVAESDGYVNYSAAFSSECSGTAVAGGSYTCTITNSNLCLYSAPQTSTSRAGGNWGADATWSSTRSGTISTTNGNPTVTGTGTAFTTELRPGVVLTTTADGTVIGTVLSITDNTSLTLTANATADYSGAYKARMVPCGIDAVVFGGAHTVTVTAISGAASVDMGRSVDKALVINAGQELNVTGAMLVGSLSMNGKATLTVNGTLNAGSLSVLGGDRAPSVSTAYVNTGGAVVVAGAITVTNNGGHAHLDLSSGSGTVTGGSLRLGVSTTSPRLAEVKIGTGSVSISGNLRVTNTPDTGACAINADPRFPAVPNCRITFAAAGTLNIGGNLESGALLTNYATAPGSTINFTGSGPSSIGAYTFRNLTISKTGGAIATLLGNTTISGTLSGTGSFTLALGGTLTVNGTAQLDGGAAGCGTSDDVLLRSTVAGTQRQWTGTGTFTLYDVDVQDMAGTATLTVYSGTDTGNNGANWTFVGACP